MAVSEKTTREVTEVPAVTGERADWLEMLEGLVSRVDHPLGLVQAHPQRAQCLPDGPKSVTGNSGVLRSERCPTPAQRDPSSSVTRVRDLPNLLRRIGGRPGQQALWRTSSSPARSPNRCQGGDDGNRWS